MKGIEEANTAKIGKDVLAHAKVVYQKAEPCDGGVRLTCVFSIELGGSLPDFIKKKIAEEWGFQNPASMAIWEARQRKKS